MRNESDVAPSGTNPSTGLGSEQGSRGAQSAALRQNPAGVSAIGPTISIRGEVSGEEDLVVEGRIDGTLELRTHKVVVGTGARVAAGIQARIVEVQGQVRGNILCEEQLVIRRSADVHGDIRAPRVTLEDGCRFKGAVEVNGKPISSNSR